MKKGAEQTAGGDPAVAALPRFASLIRGGPHAAHLSSYVRGIKMYYHGSPVGDIEVLHPNKRASGRMMKLMFI